MELKIYSPADDGFIKSIDWNHEEIKKEVAEKVKHYASLVYTEDQIKAAKTDRATLNKFVQALEGKRKEIKKQCLAPYETFEKQMKEIIAIVNEPINLIDNQVKSFEEKKKEEKLEQIQAYYNSIEPEELHWLGLPAIFNEKWLNASVKMSTVQAEIDARLEQIKADLATLSKLPDFAFESIEVYKDTLDMNKAISEGQRLSDIQKRKAETLKTEPDAFPISNEDVPESQKQWVSFKAYMTVEEALALKDFFNSRKIHFEAI